MKREYPSVAQVRQLPIDTVVQVPKDWEDRNGHVNVQYYLRLYDLGGWGLLDKIGIDEAYLEKQNRSIFDLQNHICYLDEIHIGDQVSVHNRLLSRNDKLFQGMFFVVNDSTDSLAATIEYLSVHIDMNARKSTPFTDSIARGLDEVIQQHAQLPWPLQTSGIMDL